MIVYPELCNRGGRRACGWSLSVGKKVVSRSYTLLEMGLTYLRLCSVEGESVRGLQEGCHCCWWKSITRGLNEQPFVGQAANSGLKLYSSEDTVDDAGSVSGSLRANSSEGQVKNFGSTLDTSARDGKSCLSRDVDDASSVSGSLRAKFNSSVGQAKDFGLTLHTSVTSPVGQAKDFGSRLHTSSDSGFISSK